jgi:hypothetical protein
MMNVPNFVLNIVIMCAMLTFAPALSFALANSTYMVTMPGAKPRLVMFWPLIMPFGRG